MQRANDGPNSLLSENKKMLKCKGGAGHSEKRAHQAFVNLSLIISTQLENKLPASDAEPEIMLVFESSLSEAPLSVTLTTESRTQERFPTQLKTQPPPMTKQSPLWRWQQPPRHQFLRGSRFPFLHFCLYLFFKILKVIILIFLRFQYFNWSVWRILRTKILYKCVLLS